MEIIEQFDQNTLNAAGTALGQLNGSTAVTFKTKAAGAGAKWLIELDVAAQTGTVDFSYTPTGFTNAITPENNQMTLANKYPLWVQAVIKAGSVTLTPGSVSAAINWKATAYKD